MERYKSISKKIIFKESFIKVKDYYSNKILNIDENEYSTWTISQSQYNDNLVKQLKKEIPKVKLNKISYGLSGGFSKSGDYSISGSLKDVLLFRMGYNLKKENPSHLWGMIAIDWNDDGEMEWVIPKNVKSVKRS